jgi:hypothetical protein
MICATQPAGIVRQRATDSRHDDDAFRQRVPLLAEVLLLTTVQEETAAAIRLQVSRTTLPVIRSPVICDTQPVGSGRPDSGVPAFPWERPAAERVRV